MIVIKKGFKRGYVYGGSGLFDNLLTSATKLISEKLPEIVEKGAKDIGNKLATKAVNKMTAKDHKVTSKDERPKLSPESLAILQKYTTGSAVPHTKARSQIPRIQDLVYKRTAKTKKNKFNVVKSTSRRITQTSN